MGEFTFRDRPANNLLKPLSVVPGAPNDKAIYTLQLHGVELPCFRATRFVGGGGGTYLTSLGSSATLALGEEMGKKHLHVWDVYGGSGHVRSAWVCT